MVLCPLEEYIYSVPPQKCIHTLTADRSILKMHCVLINAAFIITQSVRIHFWGEHPMFSSNKIDETQKIFGMAKVIKIQYSDEI